MYVCLLVFLFAVGVSTQGSYFSHQERHFGGYDRIRNPNLPNIFSPGPAHLPKAQYRDPYPTTTSKSENTNYVRPQDYSYEDYEDEESCELSSTPPDPASGCCGIDAVKRDRIVGGDYTAIEEYPWLVHVEYYNSTRDTYTRLCGGFLISGRYVLSAAHCFAGEVLNVAIPVNIIVGEYNTSNSGPDCIVTKDGPMCTEGAKTVPIEDYTVHPKYLSRNTSIENDIALVRMKNTVEYSAFVRPLCLPVRDITATSRDLRFYVAGWGAVKDTLLYYRKHRYEYDVVKRDVEVPFVTREVCIKSYGFLNHGHVCAGGERGKDSCKSDSGGPLMYKNDGVFEAIGIVSTALKDFVCGTENRPAVYTKVYLYLRWIKDNIRP